MPDRSHYFASGEYWDEGMLKSWRWLLGVDRYSVTRVTAMGNLFLLNQVGAVQFLNVDFAIIDDIGLGADVIDKLFADSFQRKLRFHSFFVRDLINRGLFLGKGQCYSQKVPACLGGELEYENIEITDVALHVSMLGQIHQQLKS